MLTTLFPVHFWLYFSYVVTFILPLAYGFSLLSIRVNLKKTIPGRHPQIVLGIIFIIVGVLLVQTMLQDMYIFYTYQSVNNVTFSMNFGLALPPLLYLYFHKLMIPRKLSGQKLQRHLLPVLAVVLFEAIVCTLHSAGSLSPGLIFVGRSYMYIYPVPLILSTIYYILCIIRLRRAYIKKIQDNYSFVEGIDLRWINTMILFYVLLAAIILPSYLIQQIWLKHISNVAFVLFISHLFIRSLNGPHIYYESSFNILIPGKPDGSGISNKNTELSATSPPNMPPREQTIALENSPPAENTNTQLQTARKTELKTQLTTLFEVEKVYLKSTLTLNEVVQMLGTNRTYISNLVNNEFNLSFYQFVNKYRIGETIRIFSENPTLPHNEIAEKVGFNSMSSFIIAFKLHQQCTPKEWKRIHLGHSKLKNGG